MQLELRNICKQVGTAMHLSDISLTFSAGTLNILLGPTLSGKTSLMRLMAGLDQPTSGSILQDGKDLIGVPVQKRNVAMVYQQFINYPNLTVYENIASPLRIAKVPREERNKTVNQVAELLKLTDMLDRHPQELSGGQQQRTALARALAKGADLVLLDEPLANLDYKLREELREELPKIFSETGAIFVYATTEPSEALLLGGKTATLHKGTVSQFGPTVEVFRKPNNLITAQTFSDPPLNLLPVTKSGSTFAYNEHVVIPLTDKRLSDLADGTYTIASRPYHLKLSSENGNGVAIRASVVITEITGSESYIHIDIDGVRWVVLTHGIHSFDIDETIEVFLNPDRLYVFREDTTLVATPKMVA
jgi:glycerol transport system ATP-binding protein